MKTVAESRAKRPSKHTIPAPPASRKRLRLAPVAPPTLESAAPLPLPATPPLAGELATKKPPTHGDHLADMAAEVLVMLEEIENALSQAALDVDSITSAKSMLDAGAESFDARLERFTALRGKLDHELLTCFRWVSGLRALARLYADRAEGECAA